MGHEKLTTDTKGMCTKHISDNSQKSSAKQISYLCDVIVKELAIYM